MLKSLSALLRSKPPQPTVWWGRHADIWSDPTATSFGWYCGWCGRSQSRYPADNAAQGGAQAHARFHNGDRLTVAPWK